MRPLDSSGGKPASSIDSLWFLWRLGRLLRVEAATERLVLGSDGVGDGHLSALCMCTYATVTGLTRHLTPMTPANGHVLTSHTDSRISNEPLLNISTSRDKHRLYTAVVD